jgi:hypothetical protein
VREIGNHRGLVSIYRSWRGELHREFLAKVKARPRRSPRRSIHRTQARDGATGYSAAATTRSIRRC